MAILVGLSVKDFDVVSTLNGIVTVRMKLKQYELAYTSYTRGIIVKIPWKVSTELGAADQFLGLKTAIGEKLPGRLVQVRTVDAPDWQSVQAARGWHGYLPTMRDVTGSGDASAESQTKHG